MRTPAKAARAVLTTVTAITLTASAAAAAPATTRSIAAVSPAGDANARAEVPVFAGHVYQLEVDNGVVFRNSYSADGTRLHWEALEGPFRGSSGDEKLSVRRIGDGIYHVNWVESSGMTVSHVMDLNTKTVSIYWTYVTADGDRVGEPHSASLARIA